MHTTQRAAVLQRKAREAEVDAAVEATEDRAVYGRCSGQVPGGTATAWASAHATAWPAATTTITARPNARACCHRRRGDADGRHPRRARRRAGVRR